MTQGPPLGVGGTEDLGFTAEAVTSNHICLIYDQDEQRWPVLSHYLAAGLRSGEFVRYFADATTAEAVRVRLRRIGVDVADAEERGAFGFVDAVVAYCPQGHFDPGEVIDRIARSYEAAHRAGYTGTRNSGEMSWALQGIPGSGRFLEYEERLNAISTPYRHSGICQYDARIFDGASLSRVLQVHPFLVVQGQIVRNPSYRRPGE